MHYLYILLLSILKIHLWDLLPNYNPFVLGSLLFLILYTFEFWWIWLSYFFLASKCKYTFSKYPHVWVLSCFSISRQFLTRRKNCFISPVFRENLPFSINGLWSDGHLLPNRLQLGTSAQHLGLAAWLSLARLACLLSSAQLGSPHLSWASLSYKFRKDQHD